MVAAGSLPGGPRCARPPWPGTLVFLPDRTWAYAVIYLVARVVRDDAVPRVVCHPIDSATGRPVRCRRCCGGLACCAGTTVSARVGEVEPVTATAVGWYVRHWVLDPVVAAGALACVPPSAAANKKLKGGRKWVPTSAWCRATARTSSRSSSRRGTRAGPTAAGGTS